MMPRHFSQCNSMKYICEFKMVKLSRIKIAQKKMLLTYKAKNKS